MKKTVVFMGLLAVGIANAQQGRVGVNTETPNATLDVKSISTDQAKGILIPQLTGDKLKEMTANLTANQNGMITFATNGVTSPDSFTENVQFAGYHRLNISSGIAKSWVRLEPSGLEKIKGEGRNTGWALVGRDATNYGNIGMSAIDLSIANSTRERVGATGNYAVAMGNNTTASGNYSTALGYHATASGENSIAMGYNVVAKGEREIALGLYNTEQKPYTLLVFGGLRGY